ncbi:MAG: head-tail connector protein [Acidaminococcaceae bacterium]
MTFADVKLYLRVDNDTDDTLISDLISVAEGYIRDAVTDYDKKAADAAFLAKSQMCQKIIIADLYENRNSGEERNFSYAVRSMINQMQCTPTPETTV